MKNKIIALTFDLELWSEGEWLKKYITPDIVNLDMLEESINQILNILNLKEIKATFFVTNEVLIKYPDLIKKLADQGHEIGSHNILHTRLDNINNIEQFKIDFKKHTESIRKLTKNYPRGFRAPHFSLNEKTKWILPILADNGYKYDTSIFPMRTGSYGINSREFNPYTIYKNSNSSLQELPITIYSNKILKFPIAGGIYFRILPLFIYKKIYKLAIKDKTFPIMYFHPHELYSETPRIKGPFFKTILKYWGISRSMKKFAKLTEEFKFDSIENILSIN